MKRTWQEHRARGRDRESPRGRSAHPSLVASWRRFRFGAEHNPLAPPPLRGYAWGVAGGPRTGPVGSDHYSLDELRWFDYHGLDREDVSRETVLRRCQEWDAQVVRMLHLLKPIVTESSATERSTSLWLSQVDSRATPKTRRKPRRKKSP